MSDEMEAQGKAYARELLRDQFAMAAITGLMADLSTAVDPVANESFRILAEWSYSVADAMLEARQED